MNTALHIAAKTRNSAMAKRLMEEGAHIEAVNSVITGVVVDCFFLSFTCEIFPAWS